LWRCARAAPQASDLSAMFTGSINVKVLEPGRKMLIDHCRALLKRNVRQKLIVANRASSTRPRPLRSGGRH